MAEGTLVRRRAGSVAVALFRVVLVLHALLAVSQPIAAGAMLQASATGRAVHTGVGGVLLLVAMAQVPVAVLAWRPGRWPVWPVAASVVLVVLEIVQTTVGYAGELVVHLPLGTTIVAAAVALALWSVRDRRDPGVRGDSDRVVEGRVRS